MSIFTSITESVARWFPQTAAVIREKAFMQDQIEDMRETMSRLQLELENEGYRRLTAGHSDDEFDRYALENLIKLCTVMAIKNPLISRIVNVQADYVFGRGVRFVASHPMVQAVIDEHVNYCANQSVLYSHDAMSRQERELQVNGNLFFMLATNPRTGRVTVRDIPTAEVVDIVRDPDDYHNEWFIKRSYQDGNNHTQVAFYPAIGVTQRSGASVPQSMMENGTIYWNAPVYHAAFNKYGRMKFAIPELYSSIDWALAYKRFLEDWSSIMRAFARMAMKITGMNSKKQVGAAKSKIQSSISLNNLNETNASPSAASTGLFGKGIDVEPIKTAGSTTPAKEGQPILNMVASGAGLPNTFFGDASQAKTDSLDRPTELKMKARQRLWMKIFCTILDYVIEQSAIRLQGDLREAGAIVELVVCPFTDIRELEATLPNNDDPAFGEVGEPISKQIDIIFPDILERNVTDRVRAFVNAVTQFGKPLSDIIPDKRLVCRMLLEALNVEGIDQLIPQFVKMWEANMAATDDGKPVDPIIIPPLPVQKPGGAGAEDPSQGGDMGANG